MSICFIHQPEYPFVTDNVTMSFEFIYHSSLFEFRIFMNYLFDIFQDCFVSDSFGIMSFFL